MKWAINQIVPIPLPIPIPIPIPLPLPIPIPSIYPYGPELPRISQPQVIDLMPTIVGSLYSAHGHQRRMSSVRSL